MIFLFWFEFYWYFSRRFNWQQAIIGSGNGTKHSTKHTKTMIWTNDGLAYWRMYAQWIYEQNDQQFSCSCQSSCICRERNIFNSIPNLNHLPLVPHTYVSELGHMIKGLRLVLEGLARGACTRVRAKQEVKSRSRQAEWFDVLFAQARVHCDNKPRQIGLNHDYNMTFSISS